MTRLRRLLAQALFIVFIVMLAFPAYAQEASNDIGIPYLAQIVAVIVAIFALVSAIIPDSKMPPIVTQIVNFLAPNFGNARNDPAQDGGS